MLPRAIHFHDNYVLNYSRPKLEEQDLVIVAGAM
jgi:hypothetical protein